MKRPSPQELMAYVDHELAPDEEREVEAWLAAHPEDRAVVEGMLGLGDLVREAELPRGAGVDVADDVMAAIERRVAAEKTAAATPPPSSVRRLRVADPPRARVSAPEPQVAAPRRGRVVALVLGMVAAAAAAAVWASSPRHDAGGVASAEHGIPALPPEAEADDETPSGTTVTSVDFGERNGMIFYVPSEQGDKRTPTTVVWIGEEKK